MSMIVICNKLRHYRTAVCRISQEEAAGRSRVHRMTISRIETDATKLPQMSTQKKIAAGLNIPLLKLFPPQKFRK